MGSSLSAEEREAFENARLRDKSVSTEINYPSQNILLLGTGNSGKSTIYKQIKLLFGSTYTEEAKAYSKDAIHTNIIFSMKSLCDQCAKFHLEDSLIAKDEHEIFSKYSERELTPELANYAKNLWNDPTIQQIWNRRSEFQIIEMTEYWMNEIDRVSATDYIPTFDDILRYRVRTSGSIAERMLINGIQTLITDTGGERSERKKWIHLFDNTTAIIYVTAVSEFDLSIFEDGETNRMVESLCVFKEVCNRPIFNEIPIFVFLNKCDLFEKKIKTKNIGDIPEFADYSGEPGNYEDGIRYFTNKFRELNENLNKEIFSMRHVHLIQMK